MNETKQYLVVYDNCFNDTETKLFAVADVKHCVIQFAIYVGDDCDLFRKALTGCESDKDCIEMYQKFGNYCIDEIYLVDNVIWRQNEKL